MNGIEGYSLNPAALKFCNCEGCVSKAVFGQFNGNGWGILSFPRPFDGGWPPNFWSVVELLERT